MRRLSAFLVAAVFVTVPLLQLRCAMACDSDADTSAEECHQDHGVTESATLHPDEVCCRDAVAQVTVVTPEHRAILTVPSPMVVEHVAVAIARVNMAFVPARTITPPGGPPGPPLVPLRI